MPVWKRNMYILMVSQFLVLDDDHDHAISSALFERTWA